LEFDDYNIINPAVITCVYANVYAFVFPHKLMDEENI